MGLQAIDSEQLSFYARQIVNKIENKFKAVPLNSLRDKRYTLKSPIYITIEYEDDQVIASFDDVEAFAYAGNEFEAMALLCEEIITLYQDLTEDETNLGPLPATWLSILRNFIQCPLSKEDYLGIIKEKGYC